MYVDASIGVSSIGAEARDRELGNDPVAGRPRPVSPSGAIPGPGRPPQQQQARGLPVSALIGVIRTLAGEMSAVVIGYARCSTERRDLTAQRKALRQLGVAKERIYVDRGLAGNPPRPELEKVLAAMGRGDTLVVARLSRLARSVRDARAIAEELAARGVKLSLGGVVYDPEDPASRCLFEMLAMFAEFDLDVLRLRTREGMAVARANGRLKGKQPKLTARQHAQLLELHNTGGHTISELAERLSVTIYRALDRAAAEAA